MRKKHICGGKYIASGSFGCVFNPAIYFPGGVSNIVDGKLIKEYSQVTRENRYDYVTKITLENDFEFDIVDKIILKFAEKGLDSPFNLATTPVWLPIEKFCVPMADFDTIVNQLDISHLKENNACSLLVKVIEYYRLGMPIRDKVCFNNSYKYDYDLSRYTKDREANLDDIFALEGDFKSKLNLIHSIGIYNLDIKDLNIAVKTFGSIKKAYLTDWDLAFVEPQGSTEVILEAFEKYIEKRYGSYEDEHNRVLFYVSRLPLYGKLISYLRNLDELDAKKEEAFKKKLIEKLFAFLFFKKFGYVAYELNVNNKVLVNVNKENKLSIYRSCFKRIDAFCYVIVFHEKFSSTNQILEYLDLIN